tara:strand:- start:163 stop:471 length:309 start_codon:yes stop_codon:yes gene_type:complete
MINTNKINYNYKNWVVMLYGTTITFKCVLYADNITKTLEREYDLPSNMRDLTFENEFVIINCGSRITQFKLDEDSCLIGDVYEDDDFVESVAAHDFWDDWVD